MVTELDIEKEWRENFIFVSHPHKNEKDFPSKRNDTHDFFLITTSLHYQSPQGIPYQTVMRNVDGSIMANALVNLTLMIHDGAASGPAVYEESQALTTNDQGLISCVVGQGSPVQGSFANIDLGNGSKFLQVLMNGVDIGTQQLMSVPFVLHSNDVPVRVSETWDYFRQTRVDAEKSSGDQIQKR